MTLKLQKYLTNILSILEKFRNTYRNGKCILKELDKLKTKKASQKTDIPIKIVKENVDIISHFLYHNFNNSLSCSTFPTGMKYADDKKDDKTDKTNYRPISILPNLSKVYERLMYNQISPYFDSVWISESGEAGAVLTDLSKAFDCTDHNLLIANFYA